MLDKTGQATSAHEVKRKELAEQVMHIRKDMILTAENTYAGEQMIAILPDGWFQEDAKSKQGQARLDLYNCIISYEEARMNLRNYCNMHGLPQGEWADGLAIVREHLRQAIFNK